MSIIRNEINFLLFLLASEEIMLFELFEEFVSWECQDKDIIMPLSQYIKEGYMIFGKNESGICNNLSVLSSLELIKSGKFETTEFMLFLTNKGWGFWEIANFGITQAREEYLMLANGGQNKRTQ